MTEALNDSRARAEKASIRRLNIPADDGCPIGLRVYTPASKIAETVLILPGIGVPQRTFSELACWLTRFGVRVVSFDYRGIGDSDSDVAKRSASLTCWARRDAAAALGFVEQRLHAEPVLLAHSFGGQAIGLSPALHRAKAALLVGSQLGHRRYWRGVPRAKVELFWRAVLPGALMTSQLPHSIQRRLGLAEQVPRWVIGCKLPLGVARQWLRWARARTWLFDEHPEAYANFRAFDRPLLAYGISDDPIAPPLAVDALMQQFTRAEVRSVTLTPADVRRSSLGHMGLFRGPGLEHIWRDWLEFILHSHLTGQAAGAHLNASAERKLPILAGKSVGLRGTSRAV